MAANIRLRASCPHVHQGDEENSQLIQQHGAKHLPDRLLCFGLQKWRENPPPGLLFGHAGRLTKFF